MGVLDLGGLATEGRNPRTLALDVLDLEDALALMNAEDAAVPGAVREQIPAIAAAVRLLERALRGGGRVFYVGAGTSGRLGLLDAAECPPTFGTDPEQVQALMAGGGEAAGRAKEGAEDDAAAGRADLVSRGVTARDAVVGLAASGRTPYVVGALAAAREVGAATVAVVCNNQGPLVALADVAIAAVTGPEVVMGSTRLKAGTAQKLILNMLSTLTMVRLGKVYTNLMVDMRASNAKLRARAVRMLALAAGLELGKAEEALAAAGGDLKAALVAHLAGVGPEEAGALLAASGGNVRAAVAGRRADLAPAVSPATGTADGVYYLGIDGGQSGTRCLIVRADGTVHGMSTAGKIDHLLAPGGRERVREVLRQVVAEAMGARPVRVKAAFLGLTGVVAGGRLEEAALTAAQGSVPADQVCVDNDGLIAWAGALALRPGLIAIAGSGSLVLGVDAGGRTERAGGWGYLFGDEPGAFGIALAGVKSALRDVDAGRVSDLRRVVEDHFGVADLAQVTKGFYAGEVDRAQVASLTPRLAELARTGSAVAGGLFMQAAELLADQLAQVAGRLTWPGGRVEWAPIGGVFRSGEVFLGPLERRLREVAHVTFTRATPELPPVAGAVLLAVCRSGGAVPEDFGARLKQALAGR